MFEFGATRRTRKPGLTPMIDVVFLLLVFFMLAARFGGAQAVPLTLGGGGAYSGPPRLVEVAPAALRLNGTAISADGLIQALSPLISGPDDLIVLRPVEAAGMQRIVDVMTALQDAGFTALAVVE